MKQTSPFLAGAFGEQRERGNGDQETVLAASRTRAEGTVQRTRLNCWQLVDPSQ